MTGNLLRETMAFARAVARHAGRRGLLVSLLVALGAVLEGFGIVLLIPLLATLFGDASAGGWVSGITQWLPGDSKPERLAAVLVLFGVIMVIRAVILWARDSILGRLQVDFLAAERVAIAQGLANADWPALSRLGHARVNHLMAGDIQRCVMGVNFLMQSSVAVVMMMAQAILAFLLSPQLTLLAVALIAIGAFALSGMLRRSQDAGRVVTEANQELVAGLGRFLGGMKMAMSQNRQHEFVDEFEHSIQRSAERQSGFAGQQAMLRGLWSLLAAGVAGLAVLVGYAVLDIAPPVLLALLVLLSRIAFPASQLHLGLQQIAYALPAWNEVVAMKQELAVARVQPGSPSNAQTIPKGSIRFDHVVYSHGESGGGLKGVSLEIAPGEIIGLSGESGAGKTTLVDIMTGLLQPQSGAVMIGERLLSELDLTGWRRRIGYVAQDPVLFNDSVRRNLIWMAPDANDDALMAALALAGADDWLGRQPLGLDTVVGETGALISGGERQRLSIARALLRQPSLLILDEATSAIDIAGERRILTRLAALSPRPTIIIIAHRTESLAQCDRVIHLASGRVISETA